MRSSVSPDDWMQRRLASFSATPSSRLTLRHTAGVENIMVTRRSATMRTTSPSPTRCRSSFTSDAPDSITSKICCRPPIVPGDASDSTLSAGRRCTALTSSAARCSTARWLSTIPLGPPVLPDV